MHNKETGRSLSALLVVRKDNGWWISRHRNRGSAPASAPLPPRIAVKSLIDSHQLDTHASVMIQGSGGMGKAVIAAFRDAGFRDVVIAARNRDSGLALAKQYGFQWQPQPEGIRADILVNVTPLGMAGGTQSDALAFSQSMVGQAQVVFDVVALPSQTPLIRLAQRLDKQIISGAEVIALQAVEQFALYTGVRPDADLVNEAAAFARAG